MIKEALEKCNKTTKDISYVVMNQGDHRLFSHISHSLGIEESKIIQSYQTYGHIGGSDIFYGLYLLSQNQKLRKGDVIVMASSAVGYSWSATIIEV
jgi:3-oxoacyl-[acyl-carrier-protein] synthase-3